ncbi:MAG: TIGR00282 family metallophosphoesterase [Alphaproteobacteria bacterium]|nr:TIGR00282 family metallophosphoesterase [Alphaproteobacteria bacterium]
MRFVYFGDIVGRAGREALLDRLPGIRERLDLDFVVANGENSAGGFGITSDIANRLLQGGVDVLTGGNHSWDQREILDFIDAEPRIMRPLNFPEGTPGQGAAIFMARGGQTVAIINIMGRIFMDPLDDPFRMVDQALSEFTLGRRADFVLIDIHAEATSEKMAMGHFADGRASLVVGSHSHVPTADAQILPGGTAYQTDAGMCGDYNSVIGMEKEEPLRRFTTKIGGGRFVTANGDATLCGVFVESDDATGKALRVAPVRVGGRLAEAWP